MCKKIFQRQICSINNKTITCQLIVFYNNSNYIEFLNISPGTIKTNIKVESQMSIYDVVKKWCDLMQKCKDDHERFYGYYFDDETNTTYRLSNIYISNVTDCNNKKVELSFNYDDKKEVWYPSDDEINCFLKLILIPQIYQEMKNK